MVALLLTHGHRTIDKAVSGSQLATQILQLALQHPVCNAIQTKALHVLHACANSLDDKLLAPMVGTGAEETSEPSSRSSTPGLLCTLVDLGE